MRKIALLLILCMSITILSSCYDANELDDLLNISIIGVDRGITDKWRLTVLFPTLKGDTGGGTGGGGGSSVQKTGYSYITVDSPSFFTGIDMLNSTIARRLNFMHAEVLVFSEDLAKSGMLGEFLAPLIRYRQIRRSMHVIVVKGSAMDTVKIMEPIVGTALLKNMQILFKGANNTGFFPHVTLQSFYDQMKSTYRQPIAALGAISLSSNLKTEGELWKDKYKTGGEYYAGQLPTSSQDVLELFGTAVFDGDKMVGKLNGEETRLMLIASGMFDRGFFTLRDPKVPSLVVPLYVKQARKPKVKIELEGDKPIIHLSIKLEGDILAIQSRIDYEQVELKPMLEKAFEKQTKSGLDKLIKKSKALKVDIFGFGLYAAKHFNTITEWERYKWLSKFKDAEISTEVSFVIRRTGTQLRSSPITAEEGKK